jgi:hypothetical protein
MKPARVPSYVSARSETLTASRAFDGGRRRERAFWLTAILALLAVLGVLSWSALRDEAGRRLYRSLEGVRCAAPSDPLEKFILSIASDADGGPPKLTCVYVSASLGMMPKLRYAHPTYAHASR